jgi:hypothetical protein
VALFFLTRPELVVGPKSDIINEEESVPLHHRRISSGGAHKLGHLPERHYSDVPLEQDRWDNNREFEPKAFSGKIIHASPQGLGLHLPPHADNSSPTYLAARREGYQHSRATSSSLVEAEEEDYGHLPG